VLHVLRRLSSLLAATAVAVTALAVAAPAANASSEESQFVSLTNSARGSHGQRSYSVASDLVSLARRHSQEMAAKHSIYHNGNLGSDVSGWHAVGENVGMGGSASSIHNAFMNSAPHRANILDTDFTQVGIGTAYDDKGVLYVTEVFRQPSGTAPAPAPAPRPTAKPAPRPAYRPTTTTTNSRRTTPVRRPVARPAKKVHRVDPNAALAARLRQARLVAARSAASGAIGHAVTYLEVMRTLG
jgi:hypothetical protein